MEFGIGVRSKSRATLAAVAAVGVAVTISAGCGGSDGDAEAIDKVDPRFAALPEDSQKLVAGVVNDDQPRHVETGIAIALTADGSSVSTEGEAPFIITDVDTDGDTQMVLDMNAAFGSLNSAVPGTEGPELKIEQWTDGEWLYMEYVGFEPYLDQAKAADLPFADLIQPGVFKVDLNRLEDETDLDGDSAAVLEQASGQDVDMTPFLYTLAANADDAVPDPDDPSKMRIETTFGDLRQQLADEDDSAPLVDDFTKLPGGLDPEAMMDAIDSVPMVFVYSTDDQERIDDLSIDMDMSSLLESIGDQSADGDGAPVGDVQFSMRMSMTIGYGANEDITMPTGVEDDRTDAFIEAVVAAAASTEAPASETTAATIATTETTEG